VTVFRVDDRDIFDWQNLSKQISRIEGVKAVSANAFESALLTGKKGASYAMLRGQFSIESGFEQAESGNGQFPKIEIGKVLAEKTGLKIGDAAEIVSGSGRIGENFAPVSTTVEIGGIFSTGLYEYDATWIRLSLSNAARLTGKSSVSVNALAVETTDIYASNKTAEKITEILGTEYKVLDWQDANRPLFAALSLERRIALIIIGLIVFIASLNITTTLAVLVHERRADIGVLKTCGAGSRNIILIFLFEGLILGATGIFLGSILGLGACFASNYFNFLTLAPDVYELNRVLLQPSISDVLAIILTVFILILAATIFPARAASSVRPLDSLKT
jgi:lipoprotein-releasing system permease protein